MNFIWAIFCCCSSICFGLFSFWFVRFWSLCVLSNNKCTFSPPKELIHKSLKRFMLHGQYAMMMNKGQLMCIHTDIQMSDCMCSNVCMQIGGQVASGIRAERVEYMKTRKSFFASVWQLCACVCMYMLSMNERLSF